MNKIKHLLIAIAASALVGGGLVGLGVVLGSPEVKPEIKVEVANAPANDPTESFSVGASNRGIQYIYDYVHGFYVDGTEFVDTDGNTAVKGTLAVTGASTFTGTATFNGAVSGISTSSLSSLTVSGHSSLASTTVSGTSTFAQAVTLSASLSVGTTLTQTGVATFAAQAVFSAGLVELKAVAAVTTAYTTTTLTAAQVCDNNVTLAITGVLGTVTVTLPSTSTLFADCLDVDGKYVDFLFRNIDGTTSSIFAAGAGVNIFDGTPTALFNAGGVATTTPGDIAVWRFQRLGASVFATGRVYED